MQGEEQSGYSKGAHSFIDQRLLAPAWCEARCEVNMECHMYILLVPVLQEEISATFILAII